MGMGRDAIRRIYKRALERGYDPAISRAIKDDYVITSLRTGRPRDKATDNIEERLIPQVEADRAGRELNTAQLGFEFGIQQ